jgi:hypothetical protein
VDGSARDIKPVVDPALTPASQWWLASLIARKADPADKPIIEHLARFVLIVCVLGSLFTDLGLPWLGATAAWILVMFAMRHEIRTGGLRRYRESFVDQDDLDGASGDELRAAQCAIEAVTSSEVYRMDLLGEAPSSWLLRQHEWEIATRLRKITLRRADYTLSMSAGVPGPQTAAVLGAHRRAVMVAQEAASRRVSQLQDYAGVVVAADAALRDWRTAEQQAGKNHVYLDLVAQGAGDEHAVAEFTHLIEQASRTRDAFQATLNQAMIAAEPLVLPDSPEYWPQQRAA